MTEREKPGCLTGLLRMFGWSKVPTLKEGSQPEVAQPLPYLLRDDFLSPAEASFFRVLREALGGDYQIFPKVGLKEFLFVSRPNENISFYNKIDRKHVDFLVCDALSLKPTAAVELDDASHQRPERVKRDAFVDEALAAAGLRLVRVPARQAYAAERLLMLVVGEEPVRQGAELAQAAAFARGQLGSSSATTPICPKCGLEMVQRIAAKGQKAGHSFYGCPNFPKCREVVS